MAAIGTTASGESLEGSGKNDERYVNKCCAIFSAVVTADVVGSLEGGIADICERTESMGSTDIPSRAVRSSLDVCWENDESDEDVKCPRRRNIADGLSFEILYMIHQSSQQGPKSGITYMPNNWNPFPGQKK